MTNQRGKFKKRPYFLRLWLSAIDPGLIRFQSAGRAALALLSIWLGLRTGLQWLNLETKLPMPLLGVLSGIVFLLFIIDLKPADRKLSLLLAPIPFTGAIFLSSYLAEIFWLNNGIFLLLIYSSFFFRRFGPRAGELALVTTVGFYLGFLLHPPPGLFLLFLGCFVVSMLLVFLWQFILIPYDPAKSLFRCVNAFYHNVARMVAITRIGLKSQPETTHYSKKLELNSKQVHMNRRIIEGLFSASVSPSLWSQPRLNRLQEEMFKTERGLEQMRQAAISLQDHLTEAPSDVLSTLLDGLTALENHLWEMASGEGQAELEQIGNTLQAQFKSSLGEKQSGGWANPILRIGIAARQLTHSVSQIQSIVVDWNISISDITPGQSPAAPHTPKPNDPMKSGMKLHPTTILGLQAVLATGLSMLAAYWLGFDQPNLVYWTSFVVIAGSTGESLRRMVFRIIGVVLGTVMGVFLAIATPDSLPLVVVLVTICFFLTIFSIPTSYVRMIFWLNIAVLLVITTLGGPALDLLIKRPISTLFGATVAALVVIFVLPIHIQNRYSKALTEFLKAVDHYVEATISMLVDASRTGDLSAEVLMIDNSYKILEQNLPAVTFEYNPLSRAQSQLASQATTLSVLKNYVSDLQDDLNAQPGVLAGSKYTALIQTIQSQIHENVTALDINLSETKGESKVITQNLGDQFIIRNSMDELLTAETFSIDDVGNRAVSNLARIHDTILQVASGLGVQAASR